MAKKKKIDFAIGDRLLLNPNNVLFSHENMISQNVRLKVKDIEIDEKDNKIYICDVYYPKEDTWKKTERFYSFEVIPDPKRYKISNR